MWNVFKSILGKLYDYYVLKQPVHRVKSHSDWQVLWSNMVLMSFNGRIKCSIHLFLPLMICPQIFIAWLAELRMSSLPQSPIKDKAVLAQIALENTKKTYQQKCAEQAKVQQQPSYIPGLTPRPESPPGLTAKSKIPKQVPPELIQVCCQSGGCWYMNAYLCECLQCWICHKFL